MNYQARGRIIKIIGPIDVDAFRLFSDQMEMLLQVDRSKAITIELYSEGGDVHIALAISAMIHRCPAPVQAIVYGYVASAATLVLASAKYRVMTKEAWVMVHEISLEFDEPLGSAQRELDQYARLENQWDDLLEKYTGTSAKDWAKLHKNTTYLSAEACKKLGLVDKII